MHDPNYNILAEILGQAYDHAAKGKGHLRHGSDEPFDQQVGCEITRRLSKSPVAYPLGQAVKKIYETVSIDNEKAIHELLGAINYICMAIICLQNMNKLFTNNEQDK